MVTKKKIAREYTHAIQEKVTEIFLYEKTAKHKGGQQCKE